MKKNKNIKNFVQSSHGQCHKFAYSISHLEIVQNLKHFLFYIKMFGFTCSKTQILDFER